MFLDEDVKNAIIKWLAFSEGYNDFLYVSWATLVN